jgi:uncharacterized protein (TIGR03032 family)
MQLEQRFVRVALSIDAAALAAEVARLDQGLWRPHPEGHAGDDALPIVAAAGDPTSDAVDGNMLPCPVLDQLPYLRSILAAIPAPIGRTRLMRITGNGEATTHVDTNRYWWDRYRVHLPVVTNPEVQFICGDETMHMAAGDCWLFDTWSLHNVVNPVDAERIHLVVDTVGSAAFSELLVEGAEPHHIALDTSAGATAEIEFERGTPDAVMSADEMESIFAILLAQCTGPDEALTSVRSLTTALSQDWGELIARSAPVDQLRQRLSVFQAAAPPACADLTLGNGTRMLHAFSQLILNPAVRDGNGRQTSPSGGALVRDVAPPVVETLARFERPVIIASPPRAGSTMLFEMLAQSPTVWSLGGESHREIEGIDSLAPAQRNFDSNRLDASDASPEVREQLEAAFMASVHNRDGVAPAADARGLRLLEKTPKNALRIPFLDAVFSDARFVYLARNPREEISSMIDAWRSGKFVTYPSLPGWDGPAWSMLLVPGWRELAGRSVAEIAVAQWITTTTVLLDDLEQIDSNRWCVTRYENLLTDPQGEMERICAFTGLEWDRQLVAGSVPFSRHTLTAPEAGKWQRNWAEIEPLMALVEPIAARVREVFGDVAPSAPPAPSSPPLSPNFAVGEPTIGPRPVNRPAPTAPAADAAPAPAAVVDPGAFRSVHTTSMGSLIRQMASSVLVSTYQSGRVIVLRADGDTLNTHFRPFSRPMGLATGPGGRLSIGTTNEVWEFRNQPAVAPKIEPAGKHDAAYLPRRRHVTGDISIHDMAYGTDEELWIVNTRFSCLATLDGDHSFVPRWKPSFVTALAAEDRCHLNGMALVDGRPKYVTALGLTDTAGGWRENKANGGVMIDVESGEVMLDGLSMPHSPRWNNGRLWVLESGRGGLGYVDLQSGAFETVIRLPGFTRGLAFAGPYALVGLSQVRETVFGGLPLTQSNEPRYCGVWVVDTRTGTTAGFLRFEGAVQEVFDVQILAGHRYPDILEATDERLSGSFVVPDAALDGSIATALSAN